MSDRIRSRVQRAALLYSDNRCFETCPEVLREVEEANRLRALVARLLDRLPPDDPLVEEARLCLE